MTWRSAGCRRWIAASSLSASERKPIALEVAVAGQLLDLLEPDELRLAYPLALEHVGDPDVVRDAVDPACLGALPLEDREAAPQGRVDLLHQVAAQLGIGLVAARQPLDHRPVRARGGEIAGVLWCFPVHAPSDPIDRLVDRDE